MIAAEVHRWLISDCNVSYSSSLEKADGSMAIAWMDGDSGRRTYAMPGDNPIDTCEIITFTFKRIPITNKEEIW